MYKVLVISHNTTHFAFRQPLYWILLAGFSGMIWSSQFFTMFTLDEDLEGTLLRDMGVSSVALCAALLSVLLSWLAVTRDMERLTALTLLAKPVTRSQFLVGKYLGILSSVLFASALLASVLVLTLWQKEGRRRLENLGNPERLFASDYAAKFDSSVADVQPLPPGDPRPARALVTMAHAWPEHDTRLARESGLHDRGRFAHGTLQEIEAGRREWRILSSRVEAGRTVLEIAVAHPPGAGGRPDDSSAPAPRLPAAGTKTRPVPCRVGAAQSHVAAFWSFDALQIFKASLLAALRVAILLAFSVALAPHASLVVNGAVSFLVFLLGHVSNYVALDLTAPGRGWGLRTAGRIFYVLFPNLENSRVESLVSVGREISFTYVGWNAAYAAAYAGLVLVAGAAVFSRKEIR
jgi:ABC-type transport system involved in multi-copper enzyme maturation permease subunit